MDVPQTFEKAKNVARVKERNGGYKKINKQQTFIGTAGPEILFSFCRSRPLDICQHGCNRSVDFIFYGTQNDVNTVIDKFLQVIISWHQAWSSKAIEIDHRLGSVRKIWGE